MDRINVIDLDQPENENQKPKKVNQKNQKNRKREKKDHNQQTLMKSGKRNRDFLIVIYLFLAIFMLMIGYFVYYQVAKSESVVSSSYNPRMDLYAERVVRGDIVSEDGYVLATTKVSEDGTETRVYPYDDVFAHVVGYFNNGKGGLESRFNYQLLNSHSFIVKQVINDLFDKKSQGDTVVTTLDYDVQKAAYDALGNNDGAVVVLDVKTGKVLAMVSKPDFDPNTLASKWEDIVNDDSSSVLLNRATSGLYPPGSTFKIFTTLEYIHENSGYDSYEFDCEGTYEYNGETIHCYHGNVHGEEDLMDSFANSCNTSYANISLGLNISKFQSLLENMLFNQSIPASFSTKNSVFSLKAKDSDGLIMRTAIGQGNTQVTPIHMAMIAAAIDNNGVAMKPYLVDHTENDSETTVKRYHATEAGSVMSTSDAAVLKTYMEAVVDYGTASAMSGQSYDAAGKTGSAEYDSKGNSHGWFVGYGSKEGYEDIAIAVIVEDGGSGSKSAVPVAKKVFDTYFNQ